jgi:hypothetical protein
LDNCIIKSFQSADAMRKLFSELDLGLGDDSSIEYNLHVFGTLHYRDIFKCIQFFLAHLPFQAHHDFEPALLADSDGCQIYSEMNMGDWWWDTQDHPPTRATIVPIIWASYETHLDIFLGEQPA